MRLFHHRLLRPTLPCLLLALLAPLSTAHAQSAERIWGTVYTTDGERHEGFLRFGGRGARDGHAANWTDLLTGREDIREEPFRVWVDSARGGGPFLRTVELKGYRISWNELDDNFVRYVPFAVPFGSIQEIVVHGEVVGVEPGPVAIGARIEVVLRPLNEGGGAGTGDREKRWLMGESALFWVGNAIEVEDGQGGREPLDGADVARIEFGAVPPGRAAPSERLYGTVEDASGRRFTGRVTWDEWKLSPADGLHGWTDRSSPRRLQFGPIRFVERLPEGSNDEPAPGVRVTLDTGELVELPDETRANFSIAVLDPGLGRVSVGSRNFRSLRFHDPAEDPGGGSAGSPAGYDTFGNGTHLRGTVVTRAGEEYQGRIRWGTLKTTTWDHLRGNSDGVGVYVRFSRIRRVEVLEFPYLEPVGTGRTEFQQGRVRVTLVDGRSYEMSGYQDLGETNVGILVLPAGDGGDSGWRLVAWEDLREVRFEEPAAGGSRPQRQEGS